jgi:drug/metabolite transporter (DMT)-like permease
VIVGVGLLGEHLDPLAAFGVVLLLIGIMLTARPWQVLREAGQKDRGAVVWALATGATIAAYSSVDRVGVRTMEAWLYGAILAVFAMSLLAVFVFVGRRVGIVAPVLADAPRRSFARDAIAGVMSLSAYLLILIAYSIAPLAVVAPLRESAIVLAAAWGAIRLGEASSPRETALRIGAAVLVVLGALFLAIG